MATRISIAHICEIYEMDRALVISICENDRVNLYEQGEEHYIDEETLPVLERMLRLHRDLGINEEGLHTISHMLDRMTQMREEIRQLRNRLRLYEDL